MGTSIRPTGPALTVRVPVPALGARGERGRRTNRVLFERRKVAVIAPIPKPKRGRGEQRESVFDAAAKALPTEKQQYDLTELISGIR